MRVIHDQGSELMGAPFQDLLRHAGIKSVPTTACNPQGNSVVEAVHKSVGQVLRTLVDVHNPQMVHQAKAVCGTALATSTCATRLVVCRIKLYSILPLVPSHFVGTCFLIFPS